MAEARRGKRKMPSISQIENELKNEKYRARYHLAIKSTIYVIITVDGIKEFRTSEKIEDLLRKAQNHKIDCKSCIVRQICMGDICPAILIDTSEEKIAQNCINRRHIRETLLEYALNGNN